MKGGEAGVASPIVGNGVRPEVLEEGVGIPYCTGSPTRFEDCTQAPVTVNEALATAGGAVEGVDAELPNTSLSKNSRLLVRLSCITTARDFVSLSTGNTLDWQVSEAARHKLALNNQVSKYNLL